MFRSGDTVIEAGDELVLIGSSGDIDDFRVVASGGAAHTADSCDAVSAPALLRRSINGQSPQMMRDDKLARLELINDRLDPGEKIFYDVQALLLDPGGGLKAREAEGYLVLSDRRLVFGTPEHGILVDIPTRQIKVPVRVQNRILMAHLLVSLEDGTSHTFVIGKSLARAIADAINRRV